MTRYCQTEVDALKLDSEIPVCVMQVIVWYSRKENNEMHENVNEKLTHLVSICYFLEHRGRFVLVLLINKNISYL